MQLPAEELWERIQSGVAAIAQQEHLEVHRVRLTIICRTHLCAWLYIHHSIASYICIVRQPNYRYVPLLNTYMCFNRRGDGSYKT